MDDIDLGDTLRDRSLVDDTSGLKVGDKHLSALCWFDALAHNGGALHALEFYLEDEEHGPWLAALDYCGLSELRTAFEGIIERSRDLDAREDSMEEDEFSEVAGKLEEDADEHYWRHLPDDGALERLAVRLFKERPQDFAPVT